MNELLKAILEKDLKKAKELVREGYDLNEPYNEDGWTPFMMLIKEFQDVDTIESFIHLGGDVNKTNNQGESPIMISLAFDNSPEVIKLLMRNGDSCNHQDNQGYTPIMKVLEHSQVSQKKSILKTLIEVECDLTGLKNNQGKTVMDMFIDKL